MAVVEATSIYDRSASLFLSSLFFDSCFSLRALFVASPRQRLKGSPSRTSCRFKEGGSCRASGNAALKIMRSTNNQEKALVAVTARSAQSKTVQTNVRPVIVCASTTP